jgi:hypothetical protein
VEKKRMDNELQFHIDETMKHKDNVKNYLLFVSRVLELKGRKHDDSKLQEPEQSIFVKYTPKLRNCTYGSKEYKTFLKEMKPALDHHYKANPHHPEYYSNGIKGMNLLDLIEMFFDWMAATKRHADGDIRKSIEINKKRFGYDDLLAQIFNNTVDYIDGWFYDVVDKQFCDSDNDAVREIVYDWYTGKRCCTDEYKAKYSKEDYDRASSIILTLVSMGLG